MKSPRKMKRPVGLPSIARLRAAMSYDPDTGIITWKPKEEKNKRDVSWNRMYAGTEARSKGPQGYLTISFDLRPWRYHRVGWAIHYGEWPTMALDHINGNPADNRISNLRLANDSQNQLNRCRLNKNNSSGFKGVSLDPRCKRWVACIHSNGKKIHIGSFGTALDAAHAYDAAALKIGGEFGYPNSKIYSERSLLK